MSSLSSSNDPLATHQQAAKAKARKATNRLLSQKSWCSILTSSAWHSTIISTAWRPWQETTLNSSKIQTWTWVVLRSLRHKDRRATEGQIWAVAYHMTYLIHFLLQRHNLARMEPRDQTNYSQRQPTMANQTLRSITHKTSCCFSVLQQTLASSWSHSCKQTYACVLNTSAASSTVAPERTNWPMTVTTSSRTSSTKSCAQCPPSAISSCFKRTTTLESYSQQRPLSTANSNSSKKLPAYW